MANNTTTYGLFKAYFLSISKRSLVLSSVFSAILMLCFISSSQDAFFSSRQQDYYMYARNDTHLLSTKSNFDCLSCDSPPVATNQKQHSTYHYTSKQLFEACLDRGKLAEYYMSIVLVTRNDNYGDDQLDRLQNMLDSTFLMAQDTKTRMEVLIIEWNPIQGKRSIADTYRFRRSDYLTWRIITVPPQIHDAFGYPQPKALYEFEGKNLGIRYARGEFVVCVNQDDIWSQNMYNAIKARTWRKKMIYAQRQGIHHASSQDSNLNDSTLVQLSPFATDQEIQSSCNFTTDTHEPHPMQMVSLSAQNYLRIGHEASDFTLAHRDVWTAVGGYREAGATIWMDVEFLVTAHVMGYPIVYSETPFNCHQTHARVEHEGASNDNRHVQVDHIFENKVSYSNARLGKHWGLSHIQDLYEQGLQCQVFRGGLGV